MKKALLILVTIFLSWLSKGQVILPREGDHVVYQLIDSSVTAPKQELYKRSGEWFANSFRSANDVIQFTDEASGKIIGKGVYLFNASKGGSIGAVTCRFTVEVTSKDNKYRVRIYDLLLTNSSSSFKDKPIDRVVEENVKKGMMKRYFAYVVERCDARMKELIKDVADKMAAKTKDDF